ncbi:MAG: class I SAM-dependent methyltransferase [Vicinamibacteria bacterium]|nr:class I SAM-dependent methyltransferase [Vicinamibacteria bacterium]
MREAGAATERTARGFDRMAPVYDLLAGLGLGGRIHASQVALLPRLPGAERALVLGDGTGRFLCELLKSGGAAHAVSIDASPCMTRLTAERLMAHGLAERATLRVGGLEQLGDERFDLVVTHYFLDLFDNAELGGVAARLETALLPGGHWLFSDFATPGHGCAGLARRSVVAGLYAFFRAACGINARQLPNFDRAFDAIGLERLADESLGAGLLSAALLRKSVRGERGRPPVGPTPGA